MSEIKYTYRCSSETENNITEIRKYLSLTGERDKNKAFDIVFNTYMSLVKENIDLKKKMELSLHEHKKEVAGLKKVIDALTSSIPTIINQLDRMVLSAQDSKKVLINFLPK